KIREQSKAIKGFLLVIFPYRTEGINHFTICDGDSAVWHIRWNDMIHAWHKRTEFSPDRHVQLSFDHVSDLLMHVTVLRYHASFFNFNITKCVFITMSVVASDTRNNF